MDELNGRMIACQLLITGLIARGIDVAPITMRQPRYVVPEHGGPPGTLTRL